MLCISNSCYQYGLSHGKTWPWHVYNSIKREVCQNVTAISMPFGSYLGTGCLTHRIKLFYSSHQQHLSSRILTFANKYLRQSGAIEFGISCNTSFCRLSWMTNPMVTIFWRLNHPPLVPHICLNESGQHWFRYWLVAYSSPNYYLNHWWVVVNWTLRNKLQWNFNHNTDLFIHENASENIVCEMTTILSRGRWVKGYCWDEKLHQCQRDKSCLRYG